MPRPQPLIATGPACANKPGKPRLRASPAARRPGRAWLPPCPEQPVRERKCEWADAAPPTRRQVPRQVLVMEHVLASALLEEKEWFASLCASGDRARAPRPSCAGMCVSRTSYSPSLSASRPAPACNPLVVVEQNSPPPPSKHEGCARERSSRAHSRVTADPHG